MYSLESPSKVQLADFCKSTCKIDLLRNNIKSYVEDAKTFTQKVGNIYVEFAVEKNSFTYNFLNELLKHDNLEKLISEDIEYFITVINKFETERVKKNFTVSDFYTKRMTKKRIERLTGHVLHANDIVDVTMVILYQIFVVEGYENGDVFDKARFVQSLDLRVCPYCDRAYIFSVENTDKKKGQRIVKPQIDHFFPKSKYPFLALSYQNLIPVCQTCNTIGAKGENDPIEGNMFRFPYPYRFKDDDIRFYCLFRGNKFFNDDNYKIGIDYNSNTVLEEGCNNILSLNKLYERHNHEAHKIFSQITMLQSKLVTYYKNLGIPKSQFTITPQLILGFPFSAKASRNELLYRFKKDMFEQFTGRK